MMLLVVITSRHFKNSIVKCQTIIQITIKKDQKLPLIPYIQIKKPKIKKIWLT